MTVIILLSALGLLTLYLGVYNQKKLLLPVVITGLLAALGLTAQYWNSGITYSAGSFMQKYTAGMMAFDSYAIMFSCLLIVCTIFIFFMCDQFYSRDNTDLADIYALILFTLAGALMMVSYEHLAMLFIGIETLSISLYILAGSKKIDLASNEASIKYFLMGSFSTGFLLFGIALIYGATALHGQPTFELTGIREFVTSYTSINMELPILFKAGVFLIMVGLFFKVSAVPFHFWTPDVYQGSPTLITAFMASVVKVAGFAALFRLFFMCFGGILQVWFYTMWTVAILTILVGNFSAIRQSSVKRMLAYSSIANAGYLLVAVLSLNDNAVNALFYYLLAYSIATIAAFGIFMAVSQSHSGREEYSIFHGLAYKNPLMAGIMIIAMLSLAGIPPLAGFFAKYYVFTNAIENNYIYISLIGILASLMGIFYYFRVIVAIFTPDASAPENSRIKVKLSFQLIMIVAALLIVCAGLWPNVIESLVDHSYTSRLFPASWSYR